MYLGKDINNLNVGHRCLTRGHPHFGVCLLEGGEGIGGRTVPPHGTGAGRRHVRWQLINGGEVNPTQCCTLDL